MLGNIINQAGRHRSKHGLLAADNHQLTNQEVTEFCAGLIAFGMPEKSTLQYRKENITRSIYLLNV